VAEASQWVVATMPWVPASSGLDVNTFSTIRVIASFAQLTESRDAHITPPTRTAVNLRRTIADYPRRTTNDRKGPEHADPRHRGHRHRWRVRTRRRDREGTRREG